MRDNLYEQVDLWMRKSCLDNPKMLESKISWKAAPQDLQLLIRYIIAFDSVVSLHVCQVLG